MSKIVLLVSFLFVCAIPARAQDKRRPVGPNPDPVRAAEEFFAEHDKNGDGKLNKSEFPERLRANFNRIDRNSNGYVELEEDILFRRRRALRERRVGTASSVALDGVKVERDIEYKRAGKLSLRLDLYLPKERSSAEPLPVILWVHGGAWRNGNKGSTPALRFVKRGYAVASIAYRLSQTAKFPAQIEDVKDAVRWIRAHAKEYRLDPDRIGAWGSSAGGHLVALLGTSGGVESLSGTPGENAPPARVQAVCNFFGPTDFLKMNAQAGERGRIDHDAPNSPESQLVGAPIQEHPDLARKANPITYVSEDDPPFLIVHGDEDFIVPLGQSELLHEALTKAGVKSTLRVVEGGGHGWRRRAEIDELVDAFFDEHLKPPAETSAKPSPGVAPEGAR